MRPMNKIIVVFSLVSSIAYAGPNCTNEDKAKWQDQKLFQEALKDQGYKIKKFKVTSGNCYEIYGWDKDSKKVEIYYHPITSREVKRRSF